VVSDTHFHNFTAFASVNDAGVNTRLQIQIDEFKRAVGVLLDNGGDTIYNAGDTFHIRGRVDTTVLNPVTDLFEWISDQGVKIISIPGNHDLAGKNSEKIGNAAQSLHNTLEANMCNDVSITSERTGHDVILFPWHANLDELKARLEAEASDGLTAIIHAPVNDVVYGIPNHGLDADYLAGLGYRRVLSGHYHNHVDFGNGVYSIGAMCHQTWGDVGSKAGFLLVTDSADEVRYIASHAPKFVDITEDNFEDAELIVDGNYARVKIEVTKGSDVDEIRKQFSDWGALGCVVNQIKNHTPVERDGVTVVGVSIGNSVESFIDAKKYSNPKKLSKLCAEILAESEEMS